MAKPLKTADSAGEFWATGLGNATAKITAGIDAVTEAPGAKAAANKQGYVNGVMASQDHWARKVAGVSTEEWKAAAKAGVSRIGEGARQKQSKYVESMRPVLAHMDGVRSRVHSMPRTSLDQRIQRSVEFQKGMAAYKGRK